MRLASHSHSRSATTFRFVKDRVHPGYRISAIPDATLAAPACASLRRAAVWALRDLGASLSAVGDVRAGSVRRVVSAVGGAVVISAVHSCLAGIETP